MPVDAMRPQGTISREALQNGNEPTRNRLPYNLRLTSDRLSLVFATPFVGVASLFRQRKTAARVRRALRFCGIYLVSFTLLAILTSPLWLALLAWWSFR
jgi:hypothetical protein